MVHPELILFAKQPLPGRVKTRLSPPATARKAAKIAAMLIRHTAELAASYWPGDVRLYGSPDADHPLFRELAATLHLHLADQAEGDLGRKMRSALADGIRRRGAAAVMGCDVPHCPGSVLEQAFEWLARGRNVIGPSTDGGFYFLGASREIPGLFDGVAWGGNMVAAATVGAAEAGGVEFESLPRLRDVDTWADVVEVATAYAPLREFL
jgi:rSAM/selenodomain-associated transferase 1